jgi:hypothetical protein
MMSFWEEYFLVFLSVFFMIDVLFGNLGIGWQSLLLNSPRYVYDFAAPLLRREGLPCPKISIFAYVIPPLFPREGAGGEFSTHKKSYSASAPPSSNPPAS